MFTNPTRKRGRPAVHGRGRGRPPKAAKDMEKETERRVFMTRPKTGEPIGRPKKFEHLAGNVNFKPDFFSVGLMDVKCPHEFCGAVHFKGEKIGTSTTFHFSACCHDGQVKLPEQCHLRSLPRNIVDLWTEDSPVAKEFRQKAREYNMAFQFASFCSNKVQLGPGIPLFKIQGQVTHRVSHFAGNGKKFGQVYMLNSKDALKVRQDEKHYLNPKVLEEIQDALMTVNLIATDYRKMKEVYDEEVQRSKDQGLPVRELAMVFRPALGDDRRKNLPVSDEIAAVFVDENGEPPSNIHFAVCPRGDYNCMVKFPQTCSLMDPMIYPLLFLNGERGWTMGYPKDGRTRSVDDNPNGHFNITQLQYFSSRIAVRPSVLNPIHRGCQLTQQYFVDAYVRIEGSRLTYLKNNQQDLRVDSYKGLMDHLASDGQKVGRRIILPSSFIGSPRAMAQNFQDAMSIVSEKGPPSLFITVTCNPKDPDILANLYPGQTSSDRPDIVARVFHLKVKEIEKDIYKRRIFGEVIGMVYVVEYQKRGLPHIHILAILHPDDKQRLLDNIDDYVRAEIPSVEDEPELYDVVISNMIHAPCSALTSKSPCKMIEKKTGLPVCTKEFPKPNSDVTIINCNGFPRYKRRKMNPIELTLRKENHEVDNRWVVPYNKFLLLKYKCHINTEICSTVASVKYLYKYVFKGHDQANLEVHHLEKDNSGMIVKDEIQDYINARYVSPTEAAWRIFEYRLDFTSHTIYRLPVHLPENQSICFHDNDTDVELGTAMARVSQLMAFFKLNETDLEANQYLYREIAHHYTYNIVKRVWNKRKRGGDNVIGRMYSVSPKDRELYFLRLLLLNVRGPKSFDDLKSYNGVLYGTFFEAAKARNLCSSDEVWEQTLDDAQLFQTGALLRQLFVTICVFCEPNHPAQLFDKFVEALTEDIKHRLGDVGEEVILDCCLSDLDTRFRSLGYTNESFYLKSPSGLNLSVESYDRIEQQALAAVSKKTLNHDQLIIYNQVMDKVMMNDRSSPNVFFVNGPGGTGKTHLYHALCQQVRGGGGSVICVAYSGIAASLLDGGKTVNSTFGIPLNLTAESVSSIKVNSKQARAIKAATLIIWDEAPMAHRYMLECVDRLLRDIADSDFKDVPFGGQIVVLGGDFRQTLPIVKQGKIGDDIKASIKNSELWSHVSVKNLTLNMRVGEGEEDFANYLKDVGDGKIPTLDDHSSIIIDQNCISTDLIADVFDNDFTSVNKLASRAILCPTNEYCNEINESIIHKISGDILEFFSIDRAFNDEGIEETVYQPEFLHPQKVGGMPPHNLKLKVGCVVMLLRNLDPKIGLINGTRMTLLKCSSHILECLILTGAGHGKTALIPRIKLQSCSGDLPFKLERQQFPVRLSYAMTINKSQGQSLDKVGIHLITPVFSHGQLYVALSRARSYKNVFIHLSPPSDQLTDYKTPNIVYQDALLQ